MSQTARSLVHVTNSLLSRILRIVVDGKFEIVLANMIHPRKEEKRMKRRNEFFIKRGRGGSWEGADVRDQRSDDGSGAEGCVRVRLDGGVE